MSAMTNNIPEEYAECPMEASKICGVPATTLRRQSLGPAPSFRIVLHRSIGR